MLQKGAKLFFRGQLIWEAVKDELLSLGLSNARQVTELACNYLLNAKCLELISFSTLSHIRAKSFLLNSIF